MAVTVSYPGVYIDEVSSGVHTITSVSTSIAAFFGRSSKGPLNKAVRCLSVADYIRNFGAPHAQSDLAHSVRQFFANGGTDCYVVRLARAGSTAKAAVTLRSLAGAAQPVLVATAKADGEWANTVRLEVDYGTSSPHESFNLRVIQEEGGVVVATEVHPNLSMNPISPRFAPSFVTQSSALVDLTLHAGMGDPTLPGSFINTIGNSFAGFSQSRRPLSNTAATTATALNTLITPVAPTVPQTSFVISVNDSLPATVDLTGWVVPANFANMGTELTTRINAALATLAPAQTVTATFENVAGVGRFIHIVATSGNTSSVRIVRASSNDIAAALMLGHEQGGLETTRFSNFRPAPNGTLLRLGNPATPGTLADLNALTALPQGGAGAVTQITINGVSTALNLVTAPPPTNQWFINVPAANAVNADNDGVREKLRIIVNAINANAALAFRAELWGYQIAILAKSGGVNEAPTATPSTTVVGFDGALIPNTRQYTLGLGGTSNFSTGGVAGANGAAPLLADYVGNPIAQTGFHALDSVDLFNLMILPPDAEVVAAEHLKLWGPAANYCASHRAFLLIDAPANWTSNDGRPAVVGNTALIGDLNVSGSLKTYAAVFYPRLVFDNAGLNKKIGASGAISGLMARTDATRGVWKAPAGIEADIRDVLGIDVRLTDLENGVLNKKAVNCLRVFPNGLVNWGARTLAGDDDFGSEWKYVPIRRLALNIEESLFRGTKWVVFEPNDEPLWAKIRLNINAYMMSLFRQGAFQGTSPKDAFFVKCDKETTTQDDRNKGIVNIEVGFAPLKPAEFVVIKIQQIAGDL
jgi:phage tail sheath protein FI